MRGLNKLTSLIAPALFMLLVGPDAKAAISINLSGTIEKTNAGLERYTSNSLSANISLGLGNHFMIGITQRRSYDNKVGLKKQTNTEAQTIDYLPFEENTESIINSVDLTIIPYNGVISPMVFGGVAKRTYYDALDFMGSRIITRYTMFPIPNYGYGLVIQLGMGMQLKLTQTFTPGIQVNLQEGEEISRVVKDSYTQLWLGYRL